MESIALTFLITLAGFASTSSLPHISTELSPAQKSIQRAEELIAKHPTACDPYNALAMAEARRARETSDVGHYTAAEKALAKSFDLSPGNYEALKVQTWLLLGRHEFSRALESAQNLNRKTPDDITVYGYLADANAELGNYAAAEDAAQWMLNLRPGTVAGLTRGAYLREIYGDLEGALEFMRMAYDATATTEVEDRAWLLTQMSHLYLQSGDLAKAERYANGALQVFADYHYALGTLAQVRIAQKRYAEAAFLMARRYQQASHAENLFAWAQALRLSGRAREAEEKFAEFEKRSLAESNLADNSNHELVLYYSGEANKPADALKIAQRESLRRHDVHTLDCLAWALHVNHQDREARETIARALATGIKDPMILSHARTIQGKVTTLSSAPLEPSTSIP